MSKITITTTAGQVTLDFHPVNNFGACAISALITAAPIFFDSLLKCLGTQAPPDTGYSPGTNPRCN